MTYFHGVRFSEIPTSVIPPVRLDSPAVVVGTAPIHMSKDGVGKTNSLVLCYTLQDAVNALGYSSNWADYTLCEAMYTFFQLYSVAPVVFINVLDPAEHKESVSSESVSLDADGKAVLASEGILAGTVVVKDAVDVATYIEDLDYILSFSDDEKLVITRTPDSTIPVEGDLNVSYDKLMPSMVTASDIVGGYNATTGKYSGIELIEQVYPSLRLIPGTLLAPGWSHFPEVAAIMGAKVDGINGVFKAMTLADVPVDSVATYSEVPDWKNQNNYMQENLICCWPKVKLGSSVYHMSTHVAALMMHTDGDHEGIPYVSPSNQGFQADGLTIAGLNESDEVNLTLSQANYLNSQGVVTGLNFVGGWRCWGNRTACYPAVTDTKDAFIPVKRMFFWKGNQLVLTYWQKVDAPTNIRLIQTIVDSENINLNGLAARGILVGEKNRVEFRSEDNPVTDLLDGIIRFRLFMTPPIPARDIEWELEFDVSNLESLFV
ncbi:phage tail sheath family protein [Acetomicrobium sp. S15 = DSM 107314]|uniref:phage tail sheath family protein n=1 Tax=Acetomicrobium sp. S15 = DSM 107314 TaxID=2529858 RepID=UPI0018E0F1C8|nr:phage tail sheath family protein [Acetomicrobium sp. S15 = DSM 107314]